MATRAITVRVNPEAAQAYEAVSAEEKRKLDILLSLELTEVTREVRPFQDIMKDISSSTQARGLTPEILKALLNEQRA